MCSYAYGTHAFGDVDAAVVCKMLGKAGGTAHLDVADYGNSPALGLVLGGVDCEAADATLDDCALSSFSEIECFDHSKDVGVECHEPGEVQRAAMQRLVTGAVAPEALHAP